MKKSLCLLVVLAIAIVILCFIPRSAAKTGEIGSGLSTTSEAVLTTEQTLKLEEDVRGYLESKDSPLAPHTALLLKQEHWQLIIAVSAIESSYCKRQLGNNCWGITNVEGGYKKYATLDEAIVDANGLITRWQARGRWLTVEDMNCHYVVPCNPNWVYVVNTVLSQLETYERNRRLPQEE